MACSLSLEPLARFVTGGAGARPDHPINGGQGIGASGPSSSGFFFFNPTASEPGLSFTFTPSGETTTAGTVSSEVAAVPEPSTWAMMILGFFGVGFMAYRRKAKPTFMAA